MKSVLKKLILSQQYNPGIIGLWLNPFYHARRGLYQAIANAAPTISGRILDVGCGYKPYRHLFQTNEYIGVDIDTPETRSRKHADCLYDGERLPFRDGSFDGVVCNQVLEHIFAPAQFLGELARVLRQGGTLLLTVPFVWDEHEQPRDYARYSSFGLKHLLRECGFEISVQQKINADIRVIFQLTNAYLMKVLPVRRPVASLVACAVLMAPFNIMGALIYRLLPSNPDLYLDQLVVATKSAE